ncbi:hypothetical protein GCM10009099_34690 [Caenispirillum bisanense]
MVRVRGAACWAHGRRDFHDVWKGTGSPLAEKALTPDPGFSMGGSFGSYIRECPRKYKACNSIACCSISDGMEGRPSPE